jgi:hypothetical protein
LENENMELNLKEASFGGVDQIALTQDPVHQAADIHVNGSEQSDSNAWFIICTD